MLRGLTAGGAADGTGSDDVVGADVGLGGADGSGLGAEPLQPAMMSDNATVCTVTRPRRPYDLNADASLRRAAIFCVLPISANPEETAPPDGR